MGGRSERSKDSRTYLHISSEGRYGQLYFNGLDGEANMWLVGEHDVTSDVRAGPLLCLRSAETKLFLNSHDGQSYLRIYANATDKLLAQMPSDKEKDD